MRNRNYKAFDGYFNRGQKIDYDALDWSKDDTHLGMITGRSADWIRHKRKELGKRQPEKKARSWGKAAGVA